MPAGCCEGMEKKRAGLDVRRQARWHLHGLKPPSPWVVPQSQLEYHRLAQDSGVSGIFGPTRTCDPRAPPGLPQVFGNLYPLLSCPLSPQVTLECPGHEEVPRVDKLVEKILHCSCQACGKEPSHEGLSVYVQGEDGPGSQPGTHPHPHAHLHPDGQTPEPEEPPEAPQAEEEEAED